MLRTTFLTIDTDSPTIRPNNRSSFQNKPSSDKSPPLTPQILSTCIDLTLCHPHQVNTPSMDSYQQEIEDCKQLFEEFNAHRRQHPPQLSPCNPDNRRPFSLRNPYSTTRAESYCPRVRTREEWMREVHRYHAKGFLQAFHMPEDLSTQLVESFDTVDSVASIASIAFQLQSYSFCFEAIEVL